MRNYTGSMAAAQNPMRKQFEMERRRSAFFAFLAGCGIGIIVTDTWLFHWFGVPGGLAAGGAAYAVVFGYETFMWKKHHA